MNDSHKSQIKSFVLRQGRMRSSQKAALLALWPTHGIDESKELLDLDNLFPNKNPLVFEIGFGMGGSLAAMAATHPDKNFIGVEVHKPGVGSLLLLIKKLKLQNLKIISADAVEVLKNMIPDESIDTFQIFFPDPWPKKKHHKRRLIQKDFVSLLVKKLKPKGCIHLATDWEAYAEHMMEVMSDEKQLKNVISENAFATNTDRPKTKFEVRGLDLGHDVWDLIFHRI